MHYLGGILIFLFGPVLWSFFLWLLVIHEIALLGRFGAGGWQRISRKKKPMIFWVCVLADLFTIAVTLWLSVWLFKGWVR